MMTRMLKKRANQAIVRLELDRRQHLGRHPPQ